MEPLLSFSRLISICLTVSLLINCTDNNTEPLNNDVQDNTNEALFPCENGLADIYPCNGYDLMAYITPSEMNADEANDSWGWTDLTTGKEYALIGTTSNTSFVDITIPNAPIYLGRLETATVNSPWRDVKVYNNHAFIVSEAPSHGMQVFDLTRLRDVTNPPEAFTADTHFTEFGSAHNIVINETSGYAYIVGTTSKGESISGGAPIFINIQNPTAPVMEGFMTQGGYSHDAQVVTYNGPDTDYTDREILIGSNENEVVIADVTDKTNPTIISTISYSNVDYTHQGWFTRDMRYFIVGDEEDEKNIGNNTRTIIFDFKDLDNPLYHFDYFGESVAIDHNGYIKDNIYYLASYTAGVRMLDISDIGSATMTEVGYFDTYPKDNATAFNGTWNVYPYFTSGNIIISDIEKGLFIIRKSN